MAPGGRGGQVDRVPGVRGVWAVDGVSGGTDCKGCMGLGLSIATERLKDVYVIPRIPKTRVFGIFGIVMRRFIGDCVVLRPAMKGPGVKITFGG